MVPQCMYRKAAKMIELFDVKRAEQMASLHWCSRMSGSLSNLRHIKENADFELPIHVAVKLVPELSPVSQTEGCARF